jgi:hypothetical protein
VWNSGSMPDISPLLIRSCVAATAPVAERCGHCRRTPLAGERLHRLDTGRALCDLCFASLPEEQRQAVSSDRVGASERPLPVAPKAA